MPSPNIRALRAILGVFSWVAKTMILELIPTKNDYLLLVDLKNEKVSPKNNPDEKGAYKKVVEEVVEGCKKK